MVVKKAQAGVTLIELLLAVSLSSLVVLMALSLFKDVGFAAGFAGGRRDAAFRAQAALGSLSDNLMAGRGVLRLEPGRAELLNRRNLRLTYAWGDSVLTANGVPFKFVLGSLRIDALGPARPAWKPFAGEAAWGLDSLDGNHDGRIDSDELDRDGDGTLDLEECRLIASLRVTLTAAYRGTPLVLTALVHPRNRPSDSAGLASGTDPDPAGIPDP